MIGFAMADKKASQRKASALKRSAARSAGRTRANLAKPGKIVESGSAGYAAARLFAAAGSKLSKARGGTSYANTQAKEGVKSGQLSGGGRYASKSVSPRKTAAPVKPSSARANSAKARAKKKK